jgi:hypothetical protein
VLFARRERPCEQGALRLKYQSRPLLADFVAKVVDAFREQ